MTHAMADTAFLEAVIQGDPTTLGTAVEIGERALDLLAPLRIHPEELARLYVVFCADELRSPRVASFVLPLLDDREFRVRLAVLRTLHSHPDGSLASVLLDRYALIAEPAERVELLRAYLALALPDNAVDGIDGMIRLSGPGNDLTRLAGFRADETNDGCKRLLRVGLARLGDALSREGWTADATRDDLVERASAVQEISLIAQPWTGAVIRSYLDDLRPVVDVSERPLPFAPKALRVCDLAVDTYCRTFRVEIPDVFPGLGNHSPEALARVRASVDTFARESNN